MLETYSVVSTSSKTADVERDIILKTTNTTRLVFKATLVENPNCPDASVRGTLVHQRAANNGAWENTESINLASLKAGEGVQLLLRSGELRTLYDALSDLYAIGAQHGVKYGKRKLVVGPENEVVAVKPEIATLVRDLVSKGHPKDVWKALVESDPSLVTQLSHARINQERQRALQDFERKLSDPNLTENDCKDFFESNKWVFGFGLDYRVLRTVQDQPTYLGASVDGTGAQRGDHMLHTDGDIGFTVLVEIKKPTTPLLDPKPYRNGVYRISGELAGGMAQIQANARNWDLDGSRTDGNRDHLESKDVYTVQPKGILILGSTSQLTNREMRNAFETQRRNMTNPEILTFDEILARAKFFLAYGDESRSSSKFTFAAVNE